MTLDEMIAIIDKDPEIMETVDETIKRLMAGDIVSLAYYRYVMETYKSWKPLPYEEYRANLRGETIEANLLRVKEERKQDNERVKRANRLKTPPKKDK